MRKLFFAASIVVTLMCQAAHAQSGTVAPVAGIGDTTQTFEATYQAGYKKTYASSGPVQMVKIGKSEKAYVAYDAAGNFGSPPRVGRIEMDTLTAPKQNWNGRMSEREFYGWLRTVLPRDAVLTETFSNGAVKPGSWTKRYHVFTSASLAALPGAPADGAILVITNGVPNTPGAVGPFVIQTTAKNTAATEAKKAGLKKENFDLPA